VADNPIYQKISWRHFWMIIVQIAKGGGYIKSELSVMIF